MLNLYSLALNWSNLNILKKYTPGNDPQCFFASVATFTFYTVKDKTSVPSAPCTINHFIKKHVERMFFNLIVECKFR